ncbi:putative iron-regulated membrane protein [Prauserella shujinwangii]|uniref:Putative iron-regulated membrane protein n=1 Tax=Prauserella shujinwangii TaxID=1453103 RepID=A0A2T0LKN9_9PSEU|nr:PepSY-associated TM helix domain-containing protein [Prauserella shujinwangii]PRX43480.1 putative iron-regulated membrane protein [Prauserella shujinwangii]
MSEKTATEPAAAARGRRPGGWRGLVLRLHFYAGVLVGPFVLVAALTGVLYAVTPQLESWLYSDELTATSTAEPLPLAEQVRAAQAAVPGGDLHAVRPAPERGDTTRVLFADDALGSSEWRTVFVDPGTGEVTGDLTTYGTSGVLPLRMTLDQLHRNLLLGEPGRLYSELAASWLWVVALGGLVLWVTRRRATRPNRTPRARTLARHGTLGAWLLVGALFLSATGLTWSTYAGANVADLRAALSWSTPSLETGTAEHAGHGAPPGDTGGGGDPAAAVDRVLAVARSAGIDAGRVELEPPAEPGGTWSVTEIDRGWPTQVDAVAVDAGTGGVVDEVRFADYPLAAKLARWGIDAHMGVLFGWPNQVLLAALGLGLATLVVLGYRLWWQRRPTRATGLAFGPAIPRGQWRRVPPAALACGAVVVALVGWFAPLLGLSLVAFLLVDLALGRRAARRARG